MRVVPGIGWLQPEVAGWGALWVLLQANGASHGGFDPVASGILGLIKRAIRRVKHPKSDP